MAETKYYSARILLGIGALHDLSIVYRDLKPENVLMDEYGYTRLSDFGLACRVGRSGLSGVGGRSFSLIFYPFDLCVTLVV